MSLHVDFGFLSGVVTVVWFVTFIGLCLWAWSRRRQADFAAAARMPLEESADVALRNETGAAECRRS